MSAFSITQTARFIAWLSEQGMDSRRMDGDDLRRHYQVYQRRVQDATAARYEREWSRTEWAAAAEREAWQSQERATTAPVRRVS